MKPANHHPTKKPNSTRASAPKPVPEKWVVVIKNVENDFAKVHAKALERFCCLNPSAALFSKEAVEDAPSLSSSTTTAAKYKIVPRTETRSAEVAIYAPSLDADVSGVWQLQRHQPQSNAPVPNVEQESATEAPEAVVVAESVVAAPSPSPFSSVADMVSVLRFKPYFTHPPLFMTNGELQQNDENAPKKKASRKRDRQAEPNEEEEGEVDDDDTESEVGPKVVVGGPQSALVSVHIVSSAATSVRNLKKVLANGIPGFVTCWALRPLHFRATFVNEHAMFSAKVLLDQFDAEGLRLNLLLPDGVARRYAEHLSKDPIEA